jgi:hypothetical protein
MKMYSSQHSTFIKCAAKRKGFMFRLLQKPVMGPNMKYEINVQKKFKLQKYFYNTCENGGHTNPFFHYTC